MTMELNETIMRVYVIGGIVVAFFLTLILVKLIEKEHRPKDLTVLWVILVIGIILVAFTWPFFVVLVLGMGAYVYLRWNVLGVVSILAGSRLKVLKDTRTENTAHGIAATIESPWLMMGMIIRAYVIWQISLIHLPPWLVTI
jgi:hypothetical protein